ncbi:hypothetical protein DLAC_04411 [Tieghemostelium lacteum]|uniref:Uncharacterized protein n=1 Tax=Tieghemostelium lacteum TaxID=361077 RepID=A0A151ZJP8_TIELA|nr:hypothetical protein DLAC_04411 [Tieghemostelium lacteum]|eukprot:KYQ94129.1 hypothetical protein DLAC_04411 [Tieghemostelium lacteum]
MSIPNYFIQSILEYSINQNVKLNYLIGFIRKWTMISKQWNREIIHKLRIKKPIHLSRFTKSDKILKWIELSNRYQIIYQVDLGDKVSSTWLSMIADRVTVITNFGIKDEDYLRQFSNIQLVTFKMSSETQLNTLKSGYKGNGVEYQFSFATLDYIFSNLVIEDNNLLEAMFNKNNFTSISLYKFTIFPKQKFSYQGMSLLNSLDLKFIGIEQNILVELVEKSPNLKRLILVNVSIHRKSSIEPILDSIALSNHKYLEYLFIKSELISPYNKILPIINRTTAKDVYINIPLSISQVSDVTTSTISNTSIQSFSFRNNPMKTEDKTLDDFSLIQVWKDLSSLTSVTIHSDVEYIHYIKQMKNLKTLRIIDSVITKTPTTDLLLQLDIGSLVDLTIVNKEILSISKGLQDNHHLRVISIHKVEIEDTITILKSNHPTLIDITIKELIAIGRDLILLFLQALQNNQTIRHCRIPFIDFTKLNILDLLNYNYYSFIIDIIGVNRTLLSLELPHHKSSTPITQLQLNNFEQSLSSNPVFQQLHIPKTLKSDQKSILKNILNKFSIQYLNKSEILIM